MVPVVEMGQALLQRSGVGLRGPVSTISRTFALKLRETSFFSPKTAGSACWTFSVNNLWWLEAEEMALGLELQGCYS